ncbi:hypothetical protein GJAV_G00227550 [Gymnothorax javanicus]|nr:hypothetical protein GJAV_G00227550 [Gymnothorax javanicus]
MDGNMENPCATGGNQAGYVLSNVAEVVERILTFVPTRSLLRAACVCRLWRNCARRVLRTQQHVSWVSAAGCNPAVRHVLLGKLPEEIENMYVLPRTVMIMADCETINGPDSCDRQKKGWRTEILQLASSLKALFPRDCEILGIATSGVVLTPDRMGSSPPEEHQDGQAGFALMFPSIDGVTLRPFHFCKRSLSQTALEEAGLVGNPDLRVVLLFEATFSSQGGHVESIFTPSRSCCGQGVYGMAGLALSGARIQSASVLLEPDVVSEKAAEAAMQRLKAAGLPERNTLGLMFACLGRGRNFYSGKRNVEADAFRKVFPNTPLFGFFGNGEIGCDRIVTGSYTLSEMETDSLQHTYTTVMVLVHLG